MKMAKASERDIAAAFDVVAALEAISGHWFKTVPQAIEVLADDDENELLDLYNHEQCRRVIEHLQTLTNRGSLSRVVMGMATLIDPTNKVVDPQADTLELHPEHHTNKAQRDALLAALKLATEGLRIWAPKDARLAQFDTLIAQCEAPQPAKEGTPA